MQRRAYRAHPPPQCCLPDLYQQLWRVGAPGSHAVARGTNAESHRVPRLTWRMPRVSCPWHMPWHWLLLLPAPASLCFDNTEASAGNRTRAATRDAVALLPSAFTDGHRSRRRVDVRHGHAVALGLRGARRRAAKFGKRAAQPEDAHENGNEAPADDAADAATTAAAVSRGGRG